MFTQRNTENERGALMMEAIALLGLMTMMSPMVVRQTAERTSEMEEVAVAGQMKELRDGLSNYIEANYGSLTGDKTQNEVRTDITASMLAPFLPAGAVQDGKFLGNKMVSNSADSDATSPFRVATTAQCTERKNGGTTQVCATPGGCALGSGWTCNRYRITGMVLSNGTDELDDRRASRIASMIGADGGFMRTNKANTALGATNEAKRKIYGAQGIWEGDTNVFFGAGNINADHGGRIAATTVFTSGASGDFLYRTQQDGIPGANSMFTDLDMGGNNVNCGGAGQPACRKINNAGGLEVVNGRILVRPANNNVQPGAEGDIGDARVSLAADQSHISAGLTNISINSGNIRLDTGAQPGGININSDYTSVSGGTFDADVSTRVNITSRGSGGVRITDEAGAGAGSAGIFIGSMTSDIRTNSHNLNSQVFGNLAFSVSNNANISASKNMNLSALNNMNLSASQNLNMQAMINAQLHADQIVNVTAGQKMILNAPNSEIQLNGGWGSYGIFGQATGEGNQGSMYYYADNKYEVSVADDWDNGETYLKMEEANIMLGTYHSAGWDSFNDGKYKHFYSSGLNLHDDTLELNSRTYGGMNIADSKTSFWRRDEGVADRTDFRHTSYINMTGNSITQSLIANRSGSDKSYAGTNLSNNAFSLHVGRSFYANGVANNAALSLFNLNSSTAEIIVRNAKMKLDYSIAQFEIGSSNMHLNSEGLFLYKKDAYYKDTNTQIPAISLNATSGRIDGSFFTVNHIYNPDHIGGTNHWVDPIKDWSRLTTNDVGYSNRTIYNQASLSTATGFTRKGIVRMNTSAANVDGAYDATAGRDDTLFKVDGATSRVQHFRVDPAFVSVMNDIRLTSRGGAKLSHALPNYILKGIYILTNSYTDGGWPCGDGASSCTYQMPRFTAEELGLGRGGYEFHCTGDDIGDGSAGTPPPHPMMGKCEDHVSAKYVSFSYPKDETDGYKKYSETCGRTDDACWAHPFMGIVPVPGRQISINRAEGGEETVYAHDEGECPDGYMPVMTVTPTVFELGRVNAIKRSIAASGQVYLSNPGYQNFMNNQTYKFVNIYQMGTKLGIVTKPICDYESDKVGDLRFATCTSGNRTLKGWAIAMGTVTQDNVHPGSYIWNVGGIYTNSWQATAHTYCYFNPARFIMPNMTTYGSSSESQTSRENPILESSESGIVMDEYD